MKHPIKLERATDFCSKINKQVNVLNRVDIRLGENSKVIVETIPLCEHINQCKKDGCLLDRAKKEVCK
jgi:hypothetical protein